MGEQYGEHGQEDQQRRSQLAAGHVELSQGDPCPVCTVGRLFEISRDGNAVTLKCFACGRQASHDVTVGHQVATTSATETPTGFTLSPAQLAAKQAEDPEQAAHDARQAETGSGTTSQQRGGFSG